MVEIPQVTMQKKVSGVVKIPQVVMGGAEGTKGKFSKHFAEKFLNWADKIPGVVKIPQVVKKKFPGVVEIPQVIDPHPQGGEGWWLGAPSDSRSVCEMVDPLKKIENL